ncbi:MAG: hypothetical protein HC872_08240 [Gammaproteobacteria bacterium]|nr:hypothetical protein [Gammaproteobacteria bacterium]
MSSIRALRLHQEAGKVSARLETLDAETLGELGADEVLIKAACSTINEYVEGSVVGRTVVRVA